MAEKSPFTTVSGEEYHGIGDLFDIIKKLIANPVQVVMFLLAFIIIMKVVFGLLGNWWPQFNNVKIGIGFSTLALFVVGIGALAVMSGLLNLRSFGDASNLAEYLKSLRKSWIIIILMIGIVLLVAWLISQYPQVFGDFSILPKQLSFDGTVPPFSIVPLG